MKVRWVLAQAALLGAAFVDTVPYARADNGTPHDAVRVAPNAGATRPDLAADKGQVSPHASIPPGRAMAKEVSINDTATVQMVWIGLTKPDDARQKSVVAKP